MDVLRQNPVFEGMEQQDAQEFLNYLLNSISSLMTEEAKEFVVELGQAGKVEQKPEKTFVEHNFQGTLLNSTQCLRYVYQLLNTFQASILCVCFGSCDTVTTREENFLDLSVDVGPDVSLSQCFR